MNLENMNAMQREATMCTEGPLLILAGAGSGKTRVLTYRTAYLIQEKGVNPWNIMAITFTNKAAGEMRERINDLVGFGAESIWVSTFHSTCVRILRRYIECLGYETNFTIYDADDQKALMKDVCKYLEIDTKIYKERMFMSAISSAKNELIDEAEYEAQSVGNYGYQKIAAVYKEYQRRLRQNNALDFDDLIFRTVELFRQVPEVLDFYQEKCRYIMVDEYQDTNTAQFELVRLLASKYRNLCVVGDDDQSIYKFRGANIHNILNFEHYFEEAKVVKLEQNYRSTQKILEAANTVIANNVSRKEKKLWTENPEGEDLVFRQLENGSEEARFVTRDIVQQVNAGRYTYNDCAVLYRTNAQSRAFEEQFLMKNIPYKIVGGINFYSRKEIKDVLCYLKTIANAKDELAVRRIINVPKRGIGAASLNKVMDFADQNGIDFFSALCNAQEVPGLGKSANKILNFVQFIQMMRAKLKEMSLVDFADELLEMTGYIEELKAEGTTEAKERIENLGELLSKLKLYEEEAKEPSLEGFLEETALFAEIDTVDANSDYVVLMTLHSAKGLEFPNVYLAGLEDGLFPSYMSITSDTAAEDIEEERRLAYVGITRAQEHLTITAAKMRMIHGRQQYGKVSRFVEELPKHLLKEIVLEKQNKDSWKDARVETDFQKARRMFQTVPDYVGGSSQTTLSKPKPVVYTQVSNQRNFSGSQEKEPLEYVVGDRVRHIKFGTGEVRAIVEGGRDYEITVDFDSVGTKKMFAAFAKLKKL